MFRSRPFGQKRLHFLTSATTIAALFLLASACHAQAKPQSPSSELPFSEDLKKYPGLLPEFAHLLQKMQQNTRYPAPRTESRLLPLLPESTIGFAAFPNYGDVVHQSLEAFRQELQESAVLRDWWTHGQLAVTGPPLLDSLEKVSLLHEYLGDEIVLSGSMNGKDPNFLLVAEVRKPGFKKFLQQFIDQYASHLADKTKPGIHVLEPQELAIAKDIPTSKDLVVLVRPDFVVAAFDLATLRGFNTRLERHSREFSSTPFGKHVLQEYQNGATLLAAADLQKLLKLAPPSFLENTNFGHSGFSDVKYLVWKHALVGGQSVSQGELRFGSPRHGAAAWLAKPASLGSLDFVSPNALLAGSIVLANPPQIFDDVKDLAGPANANSFAMITGGEKALNLSMKDDLLGQLGGEITFELDKLDPPNPAWKAFLKVNDADHLLKTLNTLLTAARIAADPVEDAGISFFTVHVPSQKTTVEVDYKFVDGYLAIASSREGLTEAIRLHGSGNSLAKSKKLLASLPPGGSSNASAFLYQDPKFSNMMQLRKVSPEFADFIEQFSKSAPPSVTRVYAEDSAIRGTSSGGALDVSSTLVVAAIAIPNLLRSRTAANEASAVGSVRTINTAQVTYEAMYPKRGFARSLTSLGPVPHIPNSPSSPDHAGLIGETLAGGSCAADGWCTKSGYRFHITAFCKQLQCGDYVTTATPIDANTGTRNFCSTSDGIIHFKLEEPLLAPLILSSQCRAWPLIK